MADFAEIGSGGRRDIHVEALQPAPERARTPRMRNDDTRRVLDRVDDFSFELRHLEATMRALKIEVAEQRARIRELEHDIEDLRRPRR